MQDPGVEAAPEKETASGGGPAEGLAEAVQVSSQTSTVPVRVQVAWPKETVSVQV